MMRSLGLLLLAAPFTASFLPPFGKVCNSRGMKMMAATLNIQDFISSKYPNVPDEFLDNIHPSSSALDDEDKALLRARAFTAYPPRVIVSRGLDIVNEDFVYYSPSTGALNRAEYLGLLSILDRALPDLGLQCQGFEMTADGGVVFISQLVGSFVGELALGKTIVEGNGAKFGGDQELNVIKFDDEGRLLSWSTGVIIAEGNTGKSASVANTAERLELESRLESKIQKLAGLTGQKGTKTYELTEADIASMRNTLANLKEVSANVLTAGGRGGYGAILYALGQEVPSDLTSSFDELDSVSVNIELESIPTECQGLVKDFRSR